MMRGMGNPARIFLETDKKPLCLKGFLFLPFMANTQARKDMAEFYLDWKAKGIRMKQPPQTALLACGPRIWIGGKACHMPTCTRHCMKRANLSLFFNKRA
jgi:hypothetical protein